MKTPLPVLEGSRILTDWVTDTLRQAILEGHFHPGEKVAQDLIAEELKVSRTPIREALKVLESEAFIEIRPHRGAYISVVTRDDIRTIYEVRRLIEEEIVRRVTAIIPDSGLRELETYLDRLEAWPKDRMNHVNADIQFHDKVSQYSTNELLTEILGGLNNRALRGRRLGQLQPGYHLMKSHREHRAILEAMKRRDDEEAAELMALHLRRSAERIERSVYA